MQCVATATAAELLELEPVRRVLFVLGRHVVALFALRALQNNIISRHINLKFKVQKSRSDPKDPDLDLLLSIPRSPKRFRLRPCGRLHG